MIEVDVVRRQGEFRLEARFANDDGITALFGPSGSGKSTLIHLIAGLVRPDRGRIALNGRVLVDCEAGSWTPPRRRRVGLVFQDGLLFPHLSVRRNLMFGRWFSAAGHRRIGFDQVVATLGLEAMLERPPASLSGGEKQRVALGRAVLADPELLLMDEPLAALDMARKREILPLIERLRDEFGIPIVYVSHAVEEVARLATKVVRLEGGRVVAVGDPAAVLGEAPQSIADDRFAMTSVLELRAGRFDPRYQLTELHHPSGVVALSGPVASEGERVRVVIRAADVALATARPERLSIRTVLEGRVRAITGSDGPHAVVSVDLEGGGVLTALATRKAIDELALVAGRPMFALVKTVAIDERPIGAHG